MKNNTFVTSDLHFFHENIIKYCDRPFSNVDEMNDKLIKKWNKVVNTNDDVYVLGDFALIHDEDYENKIRKLSWLTNSLNGHKCLLFGNHDYFSEEEYLNAGFEKVFNAGFIEVNINCHIWTFSHYQMTSWNESHHGSFHLFGHEHWRQEHEPDHKIYEKMRWSERKYNVCVDANNFCPIDINEIIKILDKRNTNFKPTR